MFRVSHITCAHLSVLVALSLCVFLWSFSYPIQSRWSNVPRPANEGQQAMSALGDAQFAFRSKALILQNLGDFGGQTHPFEQYDYKNLKLWFDVMTRLDPVSDFVPIIAGYYFGAVKDPDKLRIVISYLREVGVSIDGRKWRWLAQAIFLARYDLQDLELALDLAHELAALPRGDLPGWARQMPVLIMAQMGRKEAAVTLMIEILRDQADTLHPNEVNFMRYYICERLLNPDEANKNALCAGDY